MSERILTIAVKKPMKMIERVQVKDSLKNFQEIVGGYIESLRISPDIYLFCNEEGKIQDLQPNFLLGNDVICGTVFFARTNQDCEMDNLTDADFELLRYYFG